MALPKDETTTEQPSIDYEALGLEPVSEEELFGGGLQTEAPEAPKAETPEIDYEALGLEPVSEKELFGFEMPKEEPEAPSDWDTLRGLEVSMRQVPQLAYGVSGLVGATSEQITGYGEALRDWGFRGYKEWEESIEPISKETDDVTVAWQRAQEGDVGALVDWAQYGIGYGLGQLGETAAVAVLGGLAGAAAGAPAGGVGAAPAAAGGAIAAAASKQGFKALAKNLVEKAIASQAKKIAIREAEKKGVKLAGEQLAKEASQAAIKRQAAKEIGSDVAIFGNAVGMQLGSIYGEAESKAQAEGRDLTGYDLARVWGTGLATGGIEGVVDKFGLDLLKGKLSAALPEGRLAGAAIAGGVGTLGEAGTEAIQTVGERIGAGKDILSDEAINEYINAAALGGIAGGGIGGVGGFVSGNPKENAAAKAKVAAEASKNIAPESSKLVADQADAVINEVAQETPDERVARLQREAQEAAGEIELEEEGAGLPPVEPTPPVTPTPEAAVAPVEPVVPVEGARPPVTPEVVPKAENAVVEAEQKSEQESDTVKVFRGVAEAGALPTGGAFFTDSERDASAYAQLAALRKATEENEDFNDIVSEVMAEEGANDITDLSINTIKSIIEGNNIQVGDISEGAVLRGNIRLGNVLNLESFGSEVGSLPETWNELNELGLVPETWESLDEDVQEELSDKYRGKAFYSLLEGEVNLNDQFAKGIDTIVFTDQNTEGRGTHRTYLTKAAEQFAQEAAPAAVEPTPVTPPVTPQLEPLRRVARAEQTEEDVAGLVDGGLVELYKGQPVITQAGLEALPETERPRLTPEARKIQIDTRTSEAAAEAISKNLRIGVDQVPPDVRMPAGWTLEGDIYVPPQPQAAVPAPTPEVREARIERDPEVQKAAQDLRAGTINRDEYQRIVDMRMPLRKFEAVPIPATNDDMLRGLGERTIKRKDAAGNEVTIKKQDLVQAPESIAEGTVLESRLDIPAYENADVWVVSLHEPRPNINKGNAGPVVAYTPTSVLRNVEFGVTEQAAANIAAGKPKTTIATMKGEFVPMTAEQAYELANTNKDQWVEIGMNPVRHSYFYDKDTQTPVVSAEEVVQVGGMVLAKNPVFGKREDYLYARRVQMGRAGMEPSAVEARLQELGFPTGGIIRVVNEPDADFEGRTIILDGKVTGIELNAAAMRDNATIDRVLNHEFAESANADGALNKLVERLTPKEKKEINDTITRLRYEERARTSEEAARAIETLAEAWKGRGFFTRAVARIEAWASKLGFKLTRRAAEYIAARNLADINAGFRTAYNQTINRVSGDEARYSYAGTLAVTPRFMRDSLKAAQSMAAAGKTNEEIRLTTGWFKGKYDNKLRWEIPDYKSFIKKDATKKLKEGGDVRLEDVLDHPELYAAYPDAKRIKVYLMTKDEGASYAANTIGINPFSKFEGFNFRNAMLHEIQHWIQDREGFASGTSPERFAHSMSRLKEDLKEAEEGLRDIKREWYDSDEQYQKERESWAWEVDLYKKIIRAKERGLGAYQIYQLAAGEIEANDVERRNSMDEEARKRYEPYAFSNVSPEDAIAMDVRGAMPTSMEMRESRREPEAIPTFTEGTPEAATLKEMEASMAKVDAASEAKGGKPETYKISEIASVWMDSGLGERELQDAITEYTNLTPANAARVARAIAKQYDTQQQIAEAVLETEAGVTVEGLPEGMEIPKDVDPKNKRTVLQRVIDATTGVRVKPVILQVPEKTALKEQIRLKARETREAKKAQQETADAVVEAIKALELRGPMRAKQAQALAKRAAKVLWTSEKSMENFIAYAERVMANTNYDADLREAKAAQKRAKELSKRDSIAAPQRFVLEAIGNIGINLLNDPREFADVVNHYLRSFKPVVSEAYVVVPDSEMESYLSMAEDEVNESKAEFDVEDNEKLAEKYGVSVNDLQRFLDAEDIMDALESYAKREAIEGILNEKSANVKEALKGVDTTTLRADQRKLIDAMKVIDVKSLDSAEKQSYIRIGNNIIFNNNQTNGAEFFVATAKGQQSARDLAKNTAAMTKNKAWANILPSLGSRKAKKLLKSWASELQSIADTFRNAFGKEAMTVFYEAMGMVDLDLGFTQAARTLEEIQEKMAKFYDKLGKKYKGAATNQDGILSEGIVGYLIQNVPAKGEADSLAQRRGLMQQNVANLRKSGDEDKIQMADRIQQLMQRLDGKTVDQMLSNLKREYPANYESLMWLKDELFPQYKDFLKFSDENFNDQANNYNTPNYLPIIYSNASPALDLLQGKKKYYDNLSSSPKQSSYTIKRSDYTQLPMGSDGRTPKEIGLNLRKNAYNSLSDQITRAYTNPARQRIYSFLKTPEAEEALGGKANLDFFADRIERLMGSRERRGSLNEGFFGKAVDVIANLVRDIGTRIALAGSYQLIRQPADQVTVAVGATGRADLMAEHLAPRSIQNARPVLDLFSIGRRGDASSGYKYINQMEEAQSRLERYYTEGNWVKAKEAAKRFSDKFMAPLKVSDFTVAAATWMTFYRAYLAKNGIKFTTWEDAANLIKSDDAGHRRAAAHAENMTDIYQGSSDPTKMAVFAQKGKTGTENLLKSILVPFNSFGIQFRSRVSSDITEIFTRSGDWKGKAVAVKDLSATIGGTIMFGLAKRFILPAITYGGIKILYAIFGVDVEEPDEEKQKEEFDQKWRQLQGDIISTMVVGGFGQMIEGHTIDGMNYIKYMIDTANESESVLDDDGEIMSFNEYSKERAPFYRYRSFDNAPSLGMLDIGMDQAGKAVLNTKMVLTPEEMERFTPEEQRFLYVALLSDWLYLAGFNDADFARMWDKGRRDMIKARKEEEKELQRIRSGR